MSRCMRFLYLNGEIVARCELDLGHTGNGGDNENFTEDEVVCSGTEYGRVGETLNWAQGMKQAAQYVGLWNISEIPVPSFPGQTCRSVKMHFDAGYPVRCESPIDSLHTVHVCMMDDGREMTWGNNVACKKDAQCPSTHWRADSNGRVSAGLRCRLQIDHDEPQHNAGNVSWRGGWLWPECGGVTLSGDTCAMKADHSALCSTEYHPCRTYNHDLARVCMLDGGHIGKHW